MKPKPSRLRSLFVPAALFLLSAAICHAATLSTTSVTTTYIWDNDLNATGDGNAGVTNILYLGELAQTNRKLTRGLITFALPTAPVGETLVSAQLFIGVISITSISDSLSLYHGLNANSASSITNSTYQNTGYATTGLTVAAPTSTPNSVTQLDVTNWIMLDYQNDPSGSIVSAFRLQVDGLVALQDGSGHLYAIAGNGHALGSPRLELTFAPIPEPSTFAALIGLTALIFTVGIKRKTRSHP